MKIKVIVAFVLVSMIFPVLSIAGDVVIIANPSVTTSELSRKDISNIYLGKKTTWDDGAKILFVVQKKNSDVHKAFLKKFVRKSPVQFDQHWQKLVFTGKGTSPKTFDSEQALIKYVGESKGAVGYVSSGSKPKNVKTISVK